MLNEVYMLLLSVYSERVHPANGGPSYSGWGTTTERRIAEYLGSGGSWPLFKKVENLAARKAEWL